MGDDVGHHHANGARRIVAQTDSKRIGTIVHLYRQLLHPFTHLTAYLLAIAQRARNSGYRYPQLGGDIAQRSIFFIFHFDFGRSLILQR